jgi:hypothetical protein
LLRLAAFVPGHANSRRNRLLALGSGRYRLSGVVDGATVLIEDDRLYVLLLEGQRVSPFATSTALFIYAGVFALLIVGAVGWGTFGVIRRVRGVPQTGKV